jgi:hypothetical protein
MTHSRPIVSLGAFLLFVATDPLPAATPTAYIDYILKSRTAMIVLDCDPPSCRFKMGKDDDFRWEHGLVLYRAKQWMKSWGRFRILEDEDIREADLVLHLDCAQPDLGDLLYGMRYRWIKMEVYSGGQGWWRKLPPIWKWKLDPVPTCDCKDAVIHILAEYRAQIEGLELARASKRKPRRSARSQPSGFATRR